MESFYFVGKNKKKGDVSDEELDDSKSVASNATSNASKTAAKPSKKKGNTHFEVLMVKPFIFTQLLLETVKSTLID